MRQYQAIFLVLGVSVATFLSQQATLTEAQIFDQLMNGVNNRNSANQDDSNTGSKFRSMFRDMMSVNVPVFYDMVKNGSSMGINVLSGLVKVERGDEAVRSGLQGPRPLSVRIFGVPVYERGVRVRNPSETPNSFSNSNGNEPKVEGGSDDELPIYTFRESPTKLV